MVLFALDCRWRIVAAGSLLRLFVGADGFSYVSLSIFSAHHTHIILFPFFFLVTFYFLFIFRLFFFCHFVRLVSFVVYSYCRVSPSMVLFFHMWFEREASNAIMSIAISRARRTHNSLYIFICAQWINGWKFTCSYDDVRPPTVFLFFCHRFSYSTWIYCHTISSSGIHFTFFSRQCTAPAQRNVEYT